MNAEQPGTGNLSKTSAKCDKTHSVSGDSNKNTQQDLHDPCPAYTPAHHHALVTLHCASSHRPFNAVWDPYYLEEVELLRPGTKVPSPRTVSLISRRCALLGPDGERVLQGLSRCDPRLIDGWTAPFVASYLGIVIVWFAAGKIHHAILEFIRLTESHTART
ncbi:hypothetical protein B0H10DRAFT_1923910 [Mycena sp. CBHHK59/15]|nr:hypothetical protein B0H10DRAFT_1923910 [Mycena sp. CBHHK59/15]